MGRQIILSTYVLITMIAAARAADWAPATGPLTTRWAAEVTPDNVHPEYPRPQMVRDAWQNLNGLWDYAIRPRGDSRSASFDGQILVPFPVESALSGVMKPVGEANRLWYRRTFEAPPMADDGRLLLHFGAVDWHATVWVNGREMGEHRGGYAPFTFDVTEALVDGTSQELLVAVWDPTDAGSQPRGKQVNEPQGIWYTAVTGIWQTVWLEPVAAASVERLETVPDVDAGVLRLTVAGRGTQTGDLIKAAARDGDRVVATATGSVGDEIELKIADAKLWAPGSPFLYNLDVTLQRSGQELDRVTSYFGMRKIALGKDDRGYNRLMLNNRPLFQFGPLDQGWWPDGLYTAPTDRALRHDIEFTLRSGFNMLRKHVKVEPARFYYYCDRMGLLVWQDMPSGFKRGERVAPVGEPDLVRDSATAAQFEAELKELIDSRSHFPSIVMWVPFNEGWGQYDVERIAAWIHKYDPSRLVNATSGWADRGVGDVVDAHDYPGPAMSPPEDHRATVLGEFGGLGLPIDEHLWWNKRNWGYRTYSTRDELAEHYRGLVTRLIGMSGRGLAAAVYTQTTDVEGEVNGLSTYDRSIIKMDMASLRELHRPLYEPAPLADVVAPDSESSPQTWRLANKRPADGWRSIDFDDGSWATSSGALSSGDIPYVKDGTPWAGNEVWLRRHFEASHGTKDLRMTAYHNVDKAEVYLNGVLIAEFEGASSRHYVNFKIDEHSDALKPGRNVLAVHAAKREGKRAIDVGLYTLDWKNR